MAPLALHWSPLTMIWLGLGALQEEEQTCQQESIWGWEVGSRARSL